MAGGGHDHAAAESAGRGGRDAGSPGRLRRAPAAGGGGAGVTVPAAWLTARLYRNLSSDVEELLPRQAPSVLATDELRARVPGLSTLGVVVDAGRPDRVPAAERLLDDLAARVRTYPAALVRSVRVGGADEKRFFDQFGPLYIAPADLAEIQRRIQARKSWEARRKLDILFDDEPAPPLDFSDLQQKYRRQLPGTAGHRGALLEHRAPRSRCCSSRGPSRPRGSRGARQLVSRVEADLRALGGPQHYAPGMRVGLAGNVAVSVEELQALSEDLGISTVIVVSTVLAVILLFFGWWIAIPALLIPLAIGTVAAFGLAAALPLGIDRLNSSTAFLGSIVVGNGVNFGIVWLARYAEARRRAVPVEPALAQAIAGALPGTLVAALAAATSYGSLAVTHFRGFRQFGFIGGIGMLTAWVSTFLLTPPLVAWLERRAGRERWPVARSRAAAHRGRAPDAAAAAARGAHRDRRRRADRGRGHRDQPLRFVAHRIRLLAAAPARHRHARRGLLGTQDGAGAAAQPVADGDPGRLGRRCAGDRRARAPRRAAAADGGAHRAGARHRRRRAARPAGPHRRDRAHPRHDHAGGAGAALARVGAPGRSPARPGPAADGAARRRAAVADRRSARARRLARDGRCWCSRS